MNITSYSISFIEYSVSTYVDYYRDRRVERESKTSPSSYLKISFIEEYRIALPVTLCSKYYFSEIQGSFYVFVIGCYLKRKYFITTWICCYQASFWYTNKFKKKENSPPKSFVLRNKWSKPGNCLIFSQKLSRKIVKF